jgi:formate dehydrogenase subunit gamma
MKSAIRTTHILRFHKSERLLHWAIAIPFMLCFATAVVLVVFYNPHPERAFRAVFSWTHRICGLYLILFPLVIAFRHRRDYRIHLHNIKQAWTWAIEDVKWLALMGVAAINRKIQLPEQGKFNAAEKINFMMVMCTYPLFILTGLVLCIWRLAFLSWMVHVSMAALAAPLMLGHIYMALINPETRVGLSGMISGYVDRHWAKHHYTRWYRENFEQPEKAAAREARSESPKPRSISAGRLEPVASGD